MTTDESITNDDHGLNTASFEIDCVAMKLANALLDHARDLAHDHLDDAAQAEKLAFCIITNRQLRFDA